ncbi:MULTISPECIES: hypothetical protein [Acinetobacter]|uniref:Uncharacterized protein n=1 Tax=Acinetobacter junii TaxID=40215 RepID=A0A365PME9_ACIJU|nr:MULTISPECIES: hypothetical protein [Acinetobacter]RBA42333.1 hypothetical protein DDF86_00265 [Acinetobacter junii]RBA42903.1 hypothetical protein DDG62_01510 [Acinetobacter junii]RBA49808.1 hypothetical protein DC346_01890 [Acinetobacter junii]WLF73476.1 hypothetical protein Q4617_05555 [Acinetobacter junii]
MNKRLNITDRIGPNDSVVLWSANNQDYRGAPVDLLVEKVKEGIQVNQSPLLVQHFNPNADFTLNIENHEVGTYLILNPSVGIKTGSIKLPERYGVTDGQVVLVTCSQQVNNFSVNGNNALVIGAPNALAANGFFKLKYDKLSNTWYRVG